MVKNFNQNDITRASYRNQFTDTNGQLNDPEKFYVITEVRAAGAWSVRVITDAGEQTRNGAGSVQLLHPIAGNSMFFNAIDEVSGFYIETYTRNNIA